MYHAMSRFYSQIGTQGEYHKALTEPNLSQNVFCFLLVKLKKCKLRLFITGNVICGRLSFVATHTATHACYGRVGLVFVSGVYPATPAGGSTPLLKNSTPPNQSLFTPPSGVVYHNICALSVRLSSENCCRTV